MSNARFALNVCRRATRPLSRARLSTSAKLPTLHGAKIAFLRCRPQLLPTPMPGMTSLRLYTTQPYTAAELSTGEYHKASDLTLESILEVLETIGDEYDIDGYDVEYSQGVLTLKLGSNGTYVLNKQPPNKQIWLSSPKSGPKRYDYDATHDKWFYSRDNHTIDEVLNQELSEILGMDIKVLA